MKRYFVLALIAAMFIPVVKAQDDFDDIYYNPKKAGSTNKKTSSSYIKNMAERDVDDYNRRGQYYTTDIDTIGYSTGTADDFVYTQAIQKYYNPTIIVDNADILEDVLANSYGNVSIEYNNYGYPVFAPYSNWYWGSSSFSWGWNLGPFSLNYTWGNPWYWGNAWGWGSSWNWGPSWTWGPAWNWGPSWAWGPSWGWHPSWNWGPRPPRPYPGNYPQYRPNGRYNNGNPAGGWAGGNYNGNSSSGRYPNGNAGRPGTSGTSWGNSSTNSKPTYNPNDARRTSGTSKPQSSDSRYQNGASSSSSREVYIDNTGHRRYGNSGQSATQSTPNRNSGNSSTKVSGNSSSNSHRTSNYNSSNKSSNYNNSSNRSSSSSNRGYSTSSSSNRSSSYNRGSSSSSGSRSYGGGSRGSSGGRGGRR